MKTLKIFVIAIVASTMAALAGHVEAAVRFKVVQGASCAAAEAVIPITTAGGTIAASVCVVTTASEFICSATYPIQASAAPATTAGIAIASRTVDAVFPNVFDVTTFPATITGTSTQLSHGVPVAGAPTGGSGANVKIADLSLTIPAGLPAGTTFNYTVDPLGQIEVRNGATTNCNDLNTNRISNGPGVQSFSFATPAAPVPMAPTASLPGTLSLTAAGTGTQTVNILTQGALTGSLGLACSILLPTNTIAITSNANQTINATPAPGATGAGIGLSCTPAVGVATTATLSCAQTATPAGAALPNLMSTITCPAAPTPVAPTVSALAATTLTGGTGTVPVTVATAGVATASLALGCTIPATGASNFLVTSGGTRTITAPATVGANAPAVGLSCVPQVSGPVNANLTCTQTATPGGVLTPLISAITCPAAPTATITAVTAPGTVTLPAYSVGVPSSSTALRFNVGGAAGSLSCVPTGAGYSATPNPLNLVVGTEGIVTVVYTGSTPGTFLGTLVCTSQGGAGGGPFTYNLSTTVSAAPPPNNAVPTMGAAGLGLMSLMLIGLAAFQRRRRQL